MTRSGSPSNSPLISAMPAALSDTGPKVSSETTMPALESRPRPTRETRYSSNWMLPLPRAMATTMARTMATMAGVADSRPMLIPDSTVVAGPVRADSAMSRTGVVSVEV